MNEGRMKRLLSEFSKISLIPKRKETFMSISGYPHYENVVSNILKFFFEDNEHGMKNLWVRSLLESIPNFENKDFQNIVVEEVFREYTTGNQKRIDIVVVCDNYIISIENKIYACLTNDLQEYANTIEKLNKDSCGDSKEVVNIVLSLNSVSLNDLTKNIPNLCNITYDMLFKKIKENIGAYMLEASNDWLIKMQDLIYTIEGLKGGNYMDKGFSDFVYKNNEEVEELFTAILNYRQSLKDEVRGLKDAIETDERFKNLKCTNFKDCTSVYNYNSSEPKRKLYSATVIDINIDDKILTIETYPDSKGWHVVLWVRKGNKYALKDILKNNGYDILENSNAAKWWQGCEVACVPIKEDGYQDVVNKIITVGFVATEKVLNSNEL